MKRYLKTSSQCKSFVIDKNDIRYSSKAIQVPVRRRDSSVVVDHVWLPLSQVKITETSLDIEIDVPEWLLKEKLRPGFTL